MFSPRVRTALISACGCIALGGCASYYDPYDYGYGGYGHGYGYGVSLGYGSGYYEPGYYGYYGQGYYRPRYYSYGYPYGWYNGYYYPGHGVYVYDRHRHAHRWSQAQRSYWENRQTHWQQRNRVQNRQAVVSRGDHRGTMRTRPGDRNRARGK